jgi:uncharacterized protein YigA (DUF484 family)
MRYELHDCIRYVLARCVGWWVYRGDEMSILVEQMIRVSLPKYTVRVWRQQTEEYEHTTQGISDVEAVAHKNQDLHPKALALSILLLPNVNAVEVLDWEKDGVVVYNDWP